MIKDYNPFSIIKYPDPILRKKAEEVKEITTEIKKLIEDMAETMGGENGIGIAAPQVGELKRVIVVGTKKGPLSLINPKILEKSRETEIGEEGCLSLPDLYLKIKRPKSVVVEGLDINGEKIQLGMEELLEKSPATDQSLARIIQHEIDHLDGILIIDRISFWQKLRIKKKLNELKNRQLLSKAS